MQNMFPRPIDDHLWILGNDYFHLYLIKGRSGCALVETGISATAGLTLQQLSFLKIEPDYLIVSHPHSDHITGLDDLKRAFPQAIVIAGKGAESFVTHPKSQKSVIAEDVHMNKSMTSLGWCNSPAAIIRPPSLRGCRVVNDREKLSLGDLSISFLDVQGHSPGNILVHIPAGRTILVSDSLGNHYPGRGFFPTFFTGFADYMETIDRLEKLDAIQVGLAHNGFFHEQKEIENIFRQARKSALDVRDYIHNSSRDDEMIAEDLFGFYYTRELAVYSPQNILNCCRLLVRRVREMYADKNTRQKNNG